MRALRIVFMAGVLMACQPPRDDSLSVLPVLGGVSACTAYAGLPPGWPQQPHAGMVQVPGGVVEVGSTRGYAEERQRHAETLKAFWMDVTEVSNAQFAAFVAATGHVTDAELQAGSVVFTRPHDVGSVAMNSWWQIRSGTDWRHPEGPGSSLAGRHNQPVVHVSRRDAEAYADWLGRRLPSEAEWEHAALAGRSDIEADAALRDAQGRYQANVWQGLFPYFAEAAASEAGDGFDGRAPVGCYAANPFGLHDLVGNVWEWTATYFDDRTSGLLTRAADVSRTTIKGGSYLCAANFCARGRSSARQGQESDLPAGHIGFRTVRD
ncbi:MAG: formylglycine-generating enzyme family protein [Pseudomonadota bacterium]